MLDFIRYLYCLSSNKFYELGSLFEIMYCREMIDREDLYVYV